MIHITGIVLCVLIGVTFVTSLIDQEHPITNDVATLSGLGAVVLAVAAAIS